LEIAPGTKERYGQDHNEGCRGGGCPREGLPDLGRRTGKGGRPKKASTIVTDTGRIERHIIPLIGTRRVKDLTKTDINKALKDIMAGKTRVSVKTKKLRGKAIVRGWRWNGNAYRWSSRRHSTP